MGLADCRRSIGSCWIGSWRKLLLLVTGRLVLLAGLGPFGLLPAQHARLTPLSRDWPSVGEKQPLLFHAEHEFNLAFAAADCHVFTIVRRMWYWRGRLCFLFRSLLFFCTLFLQLCDVVDRQASLPTSLDRTPPRVLRSCAWFSIAKVWQNTTVVDELPSDNGHAAGKHEALRAASWHRDLLRVLHRAERVRARKNVSVLRCGTRPGEPRSLSSSLSSLGTSQTPPPKTSY